MRILIDVSSEILYNVGDIAMIHVALARLGALWPEARLELILSRPDRLPRFFPQARGLSDQGHLAFFHEGCLFGRFWRLAPGIEDRLRTRYLRQVAPLILVRKRRHGVDTESIRAYIEAVCAADLVILGGGAWITDVFEYGARFALDTLHIAQAQGKPTALIEQGMEPIQSPKLRACLGALLPRANLIALRERRAGLPLLRSLGVPEDRIAVTGDDAIELAHAMRPPCLGDGIGINLRVASYAGVEEALAEAVRPVLQAAARRFDAPLLPAPIETSEQTSDAGAIRRLLAGWDDASDGGAALQTPQAVIAQIGRCRIVVTGSYHAAVFALAQGIPAVTLARSAHYRHKFLGLADMFGIGCAVVSLEDARLPTTLSRAIEEAWCTAEAVRPRLLAAAERQIEAGQAAYQRFKQWVP
ncbi:MAG TPA: polysaccharide pyruvyl transferase family protein [Chthonomonadaceae bacterium]|nr:polysaccharide pyruvyl transferase family protein [Chthonomonadaceae bacterium]